MYLYIICPCGALTRLGRGGCNRSRENPGIPKKGGGGSDPCQDFFGGFDMVT